MEEQYEEFVFNFMGRPRIQKLHGRDHYVVPMVMITEGVHEGDNGPLLYEEPDLAESADDWNNMPNIVYHPKDKKTARRPEILNTQGCGTVLNTRWDTKNKKLRAEAWFDIEQTEKVDKRVLENVKNARMTEVSTGLFVKVEKKEGTWKNGKKYVGIARKYKPDHLAVLPDMKGACSIRDGAGLFQMNQAFDENQVPVYPSQVVSMFYEGRFPGFLIENKAADQSHGQIRRQLQEALSSKFGKPGQYWGGFIEEVFKDYVIFYDSGQLYKIEYSNADGKVTLDGEKESVRRDTVYTVANAAVEEPPAVETQQTQNEGKEMDEKTKAVNTLIANSGGVWIEDDRAELMKMDETRLKKMVTNMAKAGNPTNPPTDQQLNDATRAGATTGVQNAGQTQNVQTIDANTLMKLVGGLTDEQRLALLPEDQRQIIVNKRREDAVEKEELIKFLMNASCPFTEEFLKLKPVEELRGLAQMVPQNPELPPDMQIPGQVGGGVPMFRGAQGAPVRNAAGGKGAVNVPILKAPETPPEWTSGGPTRRETAAVNGAK